MAIQRNESDFVAVKDPYEAEGKNHKEMPLAKPESVEFAEHTGFVMVTVGFFCVDIH